MYCEESCPLKVRYALADIASVYELGFDLSNESIFVSYDASLGAAEAGHEADARGDQAGRLRSVAREGELADDARSRSSCAQSGALQALRGERDP